MKVLMLRITIKENHSNVDEKIFILKDNESLKAFLNENYLSDIQTQEAFNYFLNDDCYILEGDYLKGDELWFEVEEKEVI